MSEILKRTKGADKTQMSEHLSICASSPAGSCCVRNVLIMRLNSGWMSVFFEGNKGFLGVSPPHLTVEETHVHGAGTTGGLH